MSFARHGTAGCVTLLRAERVLVLGCSVCEWRVQLSLNGQDK
jgi:hypothetical protein